MIKSLGFEKDFQKATELFPKLHIIRKTTYNGWIIEGDLDICDTQGEFWKTFKIRIKVPEGYPYSYLRVWELSQHINRDDDWHVSKDGECCLDIVHKMYNIFKKGILISDFIEKLVYPFFANQLHKMRTNKYASGEHEHFFDGIKNFYAEDLKIKDSTLAIQVIEGILTKQLPKRNEMCYCKSSKFKSCHFKSVEYLKALPAIQLKYDLENFKKLQNSK